MCTPCRGGHQSVHSPSPFCEHALWPAIGKGGGAAFNIRAIHVQTRAIQMKTASIAYSQTLL